MSTDGGAHGSRSGDDRAAVIAGVEPRWRRLSARMIWVDVGQTLLSLTPPVLAFWVLGVDPAGFARWAILGVAVFGVGGAVADALRWISTRYRVTSTEVERHSGILVREHRSVARERIRSVDIEARLRHRLAGLRMVTIGAGQQGIFGESAFVLNSLTRSDAAELRRLLLRERRSGTPSASTVRHHDEIAAGPLAEEGEDPGVVAGSRGAGDPGATRADEETELLARLRPGWAVYNMLNLWAFATAVGVLFTLYWTLSTFGVDITTIVGGLADWESVGWVATGLLAFAVLGILGVLINGVQFVTSWWGFMLTRIHRADGSALRTSQGLFRTREVDRDDARLRGVTVSEPLLWRWMGAADTTVVTTGLSLLGGGQPARVLPRGPVEVARGVSRRILALDVSPLDVALVPHPRAALRRRVVRAHLLALGLAGFLAWPSAVGAVPAWIWWGVPGVWLAALGGAVVSYRALGYALHGDYVLARSGLFARETTTLRRDAISTVAIRQSVFQRRRRLATVSLMTSAGYSVYDVHDVASAESVPIARGAAPGVLEPFISTGLSRVRQIQSQTQVPRCRDDVP